MSRPSTHKAHAPEEAHPGLGVVRSAKAIPTMGTMAPSRPPAAQDASAQAPSSCTGRCGHCDLHPCQLHTTV